MIPPALLTVCIALILWGVGEGMFYIFQPFYLTQLGANPITIGFILGAAGFVTLLTHAPAGYISDKLGRKPMLVAAWLIGLVAILIMSVTTSLWPFVIGMLAYGFTGFVSSPLSSYTTAARGKLSIARALTIMSASFNSGLILGTLAGGWISYRFGLRAIFISAAALFIPSTFAVIFVPNQPKDQHPEGSQPHMELFSNRPFLVMLALGWFAMLGLTLTQQFTPKFLQEVHQLNLEQIGLLGAVSGIGTTVMMFTLGGILPRLGFLIGSLATALSTILLWRGGGMGIFGVAYFLQGGLRAARSLFNAQIRPLVTDSSMGFAYGISETVLGFSNMLAPIFAGLLYSQQPGLMYPVSFAAILFSLLLFWKFLPHIQPRVEDKHQ